MFLLDSNRYGRDPERVSGQIPAMIQEAGGQMLVSRLWEERRLAYPIKGHRKGTYWLTYFRVKGTRLAEIKRKCRLSDSILRVLFLRIDPRIVDTLVEHARAGHLKRSTETATEGQTEPSAKSADRKAEPGGNQPTQEPISDAKEA
jgi:small subunit ribosomal protein S6